MCCGEFSPRLMTRLSGKTCQADGPLRGTKGTETDWFAWHHCLKSSGLGEPLRQELTGGRDRWS